MKVSNVVTGMAIVGALSVVPSAHAAMQQASATVQVSDDAIESRIEAVLKKDATLTARGIDVESERGTVTLTGKVKNASEKARAERLAKVDGVTTVVNQLEIDPKADQSKVDRAADKTKDGLNKAVDATAKGVEKGVTESAKAVGKAAEKTGEAVGTAGEKVADATLTTRIAGAYVDEPLLKDSSINVDTNDNVVTLRGTVLTAAGKTKAEEIAARTSGVKRVVNELVVKP
jgi:hyperosmotically inducible periplasmic protein